MPAPWSNASAMRAGRFSGLTVLLMVLAGVGLGALGVWVATRDSAPTAAEESHEGDLPPGIVEIPETAQQNAEIQIVPAVQMRLPLTLDVTGAVAPDESRVTHIRSLARGVIESVAARLGDRVRAGQTLATIDNIELGELIGQYLSESAALRQAQADREVREKTLARSEELFKLEAIAQQTLELRRAEAKNAVAGVESQQARVAKVEEQIHRYGLSDKDLAQLGSGKDSEGGHRTASHNVLRAPFAGVVTKYDVAVGELVEPDRELFTITDISTVWVLADVYEKDIAKVQRDQDVSIKLDAYPDQVFTGRLSYVSDLIDPQTRTAKVRCVVPNPGGLLKLDMFARVAIPTNDIREAIAVPVAAVQQVDGQPVVFVQKSPVRFERRDVRVGATAGNVVEILAGLQPDERVVGPGSFYLKTALLQERIGDEH